MPRKSSSHSKSRKPLRLVAFVFAGTLVVFVALLLWLGRPMRFMKLSDLSLLLLNNCYQCQVKLDEADLTLRLYHRGQRLADLVQFDSAVSSRPSIELAELHLPSSEYLIIKVNNQGSGGGAYFTVFRIQKQTVKPLNNFGSIYSCYNPKLIKDKTTLFFENHGSHCDWLDTGSGKGNKIELPLL